ncbi:MAG: hypothetical protein NT004_10555 [Bacteroidetes bacterium]|nr:hypothetical protein [Bacteroidota bacterium]
MDNMIVNISEPAVFSNLISFFLCFIFSLLIFGIKSLARQPQGNDSLNKLDDKDIEGLKWFMVAFGCWALMSIVRILFKSEDRMTIGLYACISIFNSYCLLRAVSSIIIDNGFRKHNNGVEISKKSTLKVWIVIAILSVLALLIITYVFKITIDKKYSDNNFVENFFKIFIGLPDAVFSIVSLVILSKRISAAFKVRKLHRLNGWTYLTLALVILAQILYYIMPGEKDIVRSPLYLQSCVPLFHICSIVYTTLIFILILLLLYSYPIKDESRKDAETDKKTPENEQERNNLSIMDTPEPGRMEIPVEEFQKSNPSNGDVNRLYEYYDKIIFKLSDEKFGFVLTEKGANQNHEFYCDGHPVIFQKFFRLALLVKFNEKNNQRNNPKNLAELVTLATGDASTKPNYEWRFEDKDKGTVFKDPNSFCPKLDTIFFDFFRDDHKTRYFYFKIPPENITIPELAEKQVTNMKPEEAFKCYKAKYQCLNWNKPPKRSLITQNMYFIPDDKTLSHENH